MANTASAGLNAILKKAFAHVPKGRETAAVHIENEEIFTRTKNFTLQASPGSSCKHGAVCSGGSKCDPARFVCTCDDGT
ncbi:hypothetical protein T08_12581, partial [Trichinella sp. T8]